ncbi:hypothetical protein BC830DRAFT_1126247 [Chytriomyces sp. MP71]|nr:hypothetical protein BC830DRAFT_1126247 [Chytriomyces sp. MP71]
MVLSETTRAYFIEGLIQVPISLILNLIVIYGNALHLRKLAPSSFLIYWICVCDATINAISLYIMVQQYSAGSLGIEATLCQTLAFFTTLCGCSSIGLCAGLTFFRYLIVVREWNLSSKFVHCYVLTVFFLPSALLSIPFILHSENVTYGLSISNTMCAIQWQDTQLESKIVAWCCIILLSIPLSFIGFAYASIYWKTNKSVEEMKVSGVMRVVSTASRSEYETRGPPELERTTKNETTCLLLLQSIALVSVFVIGWGPYMGNVLYQAITHNQLPPVWDYITEMIVVVMHAVNPILALVFDVEMRKHVTHIFLSS